MISDDTILVRLRGLPPLEPPGDLLARVLASRAAGVRVALPIEVSLGGRRWLRAGLGAAAVVTLALALSRWIGSGLEAKRRGAGDVSAEILRGTLFWPEAGAAQTTSAPPRQPRYSVVLGSDLNTTRLSAGTWVYRAETTTDGVLTQTTGRIRVTLAPSTIDGRRVWLASSVREGRQGWGGFPDTAYLERESLRPLRHIVFGYKQRTRIEQVFWGDSGREAIDIGEPRPRAFRRTVQLPFPGDAPFVTNWFLYDLKLLAQALPLERGWRGSVYQVWWFSLPQREAFIPLNLRVTGRARVTVPAGTFDCWILDVRLSRRADEIERMTVWVSRDRGWVIKTEEGAGDYLVQSSLESHVPQ